MQRGKVMNERSISLVLLRALLECIELLEFLISPSAVSLFLILSTYYFLVQAATFSI